MNRVCSASLLFLLPLFVGSLASSALAARIGVDARYGGAAVNLLTGKDFDQFRATLLAGSNTLVSVTTFSTSYFGYLDALIVRQSLFTNDLISAAEIADIHTFVNTGHGLLLLGDAGFQTDDTVPNLNDLARPFGVTFGTNSLYPEGLTITGFFEHAVTLGVNSIGLDFYRPMIRISNPAVDLIRPSGEYDMLAAVPGVEGRGNVVLCGDCTLWTDTDVPSDRNIDFGDNRLLLENIGAYITVPSLAAKQQGAAIRLSWSSAMANLYHLQWCENPAGGAWQRLTNEMQRIGTSNIVLDGISASQRYYRLQR